MRLDDFSKIEAELTKIEKSGKETFSQASVGDIAGRKVTLSRGDKVSTAELRTKIKTLLRRDATTTGIAFWRNYFLALLSGKTLSERKANVHDKAASLLDQVGRIEQMIHQEGSEKVKKYAEKFGLDEKGFTELLGKLGGKDPLDFESKEALKEQLEKKGANTTFIAYMMKKYSDLKRK